MENESESTEISWLIKIPILFWLSVGVYRLFTKGWGNALWFVFVTPILLVLLFIFGFFFFLFILFGAFVAFLENLPPGLLALFVAFAVLLIIGAFFMKGNYRKERIFEQLGKFRMEADGELMAGKIDEEQYLNIVRKIREYEKIVA